MRIVSFSHWFLVYVRWERFCLERLWYWRLGLLVLAWLIILCFVEIRYYDDLWPWYALRWLIRTVGLVVWVGSLLLVWTMGYYDRWQMYTWFLPYVFRRLVGYYKAW